jgi:hypothetical protein
VLTIAIDCDGTLVEAGAGPQDKLTWRPGAKDAIKALAKAGHRLVLFSCRSNPIHDGMGRQRDAEDFYRWGTVPQAVQDSWHYFGTMRKFLQDEGVWDLFAEVWQSPGKPLAEVYIDDRFETPDWSRIRMELATGSGKV